MLIPVTLKMKDDQKCLPSVGTSYVFLVVVIYKWHLLYFWFCGFCDAFESSRLIMVSRIYSF